MSKNRKDFVRLYVSLIQAVSEVLDQRAAASVLGRANEILEVMDNPLKGTIWEDKQ